jgi:sulfatase maturation enzyme AslB (radical SAM superfamily)
MYFSKTLYYVNIGYITISYKLLGGNIMNRVNTLNTANLPYLAIAITKSCNCKCFYCSNGGECQGISKTKETISFDKLKTIISNANDIGIKKFRITGGEPTIVPYFGKLIEFIMSFDDCKIRINTNGYKLYKYIDILIKYKERVDIVFSVDSISKNINGVYFPKYLSKDVIDVTKKLKENGISVRYNIVVTSLNECEVKELILKAIDELQVNIKMLDLNKNSEYFGYNGKVVGEEADLFWKKLYVPMKNFYDWLEEISSSSNSEWTTGFISNGNGIPMSSYFRGENWIQVKDSTRGTKYVDFCIRECSYYKTGNCQEGVFSLMLSPNAILHFSGCKNQDIYFDLGKCEDDQQIQDAFKSLLSLIRKDE